MWRLGRKWSLTRLFLARLPFSLPFSQAEEEQETCEGMEGKEVPRVSFSRVSVSVTFLSSGRGAGDARRHGRKRTSSRVFCFHYLLAKQETTATPTRLIVLCPCFFVPFSLKSVIVSWFLVRFISYRMKIRHWKVSWEFQMAEVSLPSVMIMYSPLRYVNTFTAEVMTCSLPVWLAFKVTKSRAGQFCAIIIN